MSKREAEGAKVPLVERVAELAMRLGRRHLADYGATTSRHDFTQRQLMTCLILRAYLKSTSRGVLDLLAASASLRERLGLREKLPHHNRAWYEEYAPSCHSLFNDQCSTCPWPHLLILSPDWSRGRRRPIIL